MFKIRNVLFFIGGALLLFLSFLARTATFSDSELFSLSNMKIVFWILLILGVGFLIAHFLDKRESEKSHKKEEKEH